MKTIGRVAELWRYPVSSVGGQPLQQIQVTPGGISGDRRFALFDPENGLAAAPEREPRWRAALFLQALRDEDARLPQLRFPDGEAFWLDDSRLAARLKSHFGFAVGIGAYGGLDDGADMRFPIVSNRYAPAALHLVTSASLRHLADMAAVPLPDHRRFRPSILIETTEGGSFLENTWIGHEITIGSTLVSVTEPTRRCGMTMIAQPEFDEQPEILRGIMRHNARNLGVYATVKSRVTIGVGDPVYAGI